MSLNKRLRISNCKNHEHVHKLYISIYIKASSLVSQMRPLGGNLGPLSVAVDQERGTASVRNSRELKFWKWWQISSSGYHVRPVQTLNDLRTHLWQFSLTLSVYLHLFLYQHYQRSCVQIVESNFFPSFSLHVFRSVCLFLKESKRL